MIRRHFLISYFIYIYFHICWRNDSDTQKREYKHYKYWWSLWQLTKVLLSIIIKIPDTFQKTRQFVY